MPHPHGGLLTEELKFRLNLNVLEDLVYEVENFLSEDQIFDLQTFISNTPSEDWYRPDTDGTIWEGRNLTLPANIKELLELKVSKLFKNYTRIHDISDLIAYRPGTGMGLHRDNVNPDDLINVFGVVIYLNDNYLGGEIYYPDIGLSVKPKAGSLVVHPAGLLHGVKEVEEGVRYMISTFVKGDESTVFELEV